MTRNTIEFCVYGKYALFSDPLTKTGGEKFTYSIPTYEALKGIAESIYWKPTFRWVIDDVRIMNPIEMYPRTTRPIDYNDSAAADLTVATYLTMVKYHVRAHFEWNMLREDLAADRNENKHLEMAKRFVAKGGRRDIFLGTRECQGYVEPCRFEDGNGYYDAMSRSFGIMEHGITYPDNYGPMKIRLWSPIMRNGVIHFIRPEECQIVKPLHKMATKQFHLGKNVYPVEQEDTI